MTTSEAVTPALVAPRGVSGVPDLPVDRMTLNRWIRHGLVRLELPGSGNRRDYPPEELRALRALVAATTLGGIPRWPAPGWTPAGRAFLADVADAARSNPPGTVVEITTPVPYVHHIVIVPEP